MIKGGKGGANTLTGLRFEGERDLAGALVKLEGYQVSGPRILFNGKEIGLLLTKHEIYSGFLKPHGVDGRKILSGLLLPDKAIILPDKKRVTILELKFQQTPGSVDEKLQTCDYKRKQYLKLFGPLGYVVEYTYVLGDWFLAPKYKDALNYVEAMGCHYYFGELPLEALGLPTS